MGSAGFSLPAGGSYVCTPAWSVARFALGHACVYIVTQGSAEFAVGGPWMTLKPGRIYLIPPSDHARRRCRERMHVDWVHALPDSPLLAHRLRGLGTIVSWRTDAWPDWRDAMRSIADGPALPFARQLRVEAFVASLAAAALHDAPSPPLDARFETVVRWIDQHAGGMPTLAACARVAGLSPIHFHRAFTRALGMTPHAYAQRRRLARALELLRGSGWPIARIAEQCGFQDAFYFSRAFRRAYGVPPSRARGTGAP